MKKVILIATSFMMASYIVTAQEISVRDYVEVTGTHTYKAMPDSIVVNIILKDNSSATKSDIATQEREMIESLKQLNIDTKTALKLVDYSTINSKRNNMASYKFYTLNLDGASQVDNVFAALNSKGIMNVDVAYVGLKNTKAITLNIKAEAVKNAKLQAATLVEAAGNKLGKPIYIMDSRTYYPVNFMARKSSMMMDSVAGAEAEPTQVEFKETSLEANVTVRFLIE